MHAHLLTLSQHFAILANDDAIIDALACWARCCAPPHYKGYPLSVLECTSLKGCVLAGRRQLPGGEASR